MIMLRNNSHDKIIRVCMGIFTTALRNKKLVKLSIKIPHLISAVYRLLSDRLLHWREPIFQRVTHFEVFYVHKESFFMGSLQRRKRSDNKRCTEVFSFRIWLFFFIPQSGRKYSRTKSYSFGMTFSSQDDYLTAGAWATCGSRLIIWRSNGNWKTWSMIYARNYGGHQLRVRTPGI